MASTLPGGDACSSELKADRQFGPRVNAACREFDFTLLFEDGFFMLLPAVLFLLSVPWRFWSLWKSPVKLTSRRLAIGKLVGSVPFSTPSPPPQTPVRTTANIYRRRSSPPSLPSTFSTPSTPPNLFGPPSRSPPPSSPPSPLSRPPSSPSSKTNAPSTPPISW